MTRIHANDYELRSFVLICVNSRNLMILLISNYMRLSEVVKRNMYERANGFIY